MAMANDAPAPAWRNFAVWSAAGAILSAPVMWGGISLLHDDGFYAAIRSRGVAAILAAALLFSMAMAGFGNRSRPVSLRHFRNFFVLNALPAVAFLLLLWGFVTLDGAGALDALGASDWAAAGTGSLLLAVACLGLVVTASARGGAGLIDDEATAEDMRERGRLFVLSFAWMVVCGLLLVLLALAGPAGRLSSAGALAGALLLTAVLAYLTIAAWRVSDELARTLSNETGTIGFYLVLAIGGGWAMLAHLGHVAAPAPLDWLTLFTVTMFAASFIALGRRKLLVH